MPRKMNDTQHRNLDKVQQRRRLRSLEGKPTEHTKEIFKRPAYKKDSCN